MTSIADLFGIWTKELANYIEIVAALIIAGAALEAFVRALIVFVRRDLPPVAKEAVRLRLGRWLAVSLEFELAADILRTAIAPTWNEIGLLAAIIGLRTILNYFLQKEIDRATAQGAPPARPGQTTRPAGGPAEAQPRDGARSIA